MPDPSTRPSEAYEIGALIFAIAEQMSSYFERAVSELGLTQAQGRLIMELRDPATMRTLAEQLHCDASNITGLVDRMEERGWVRRRLDPTDRRVRWVELTRQGASLLEQVEARVAADRPSVLGLPEPDQATLHRLLQRVLEMEESRAARASTSAATADLPHPPDVPTAAAPNDGQPPARPRVPIRGTA